MSVSSSNASSRVPKPPGQHGVAERLLDEQQLPGEEVLHRHQLRVLGDELVGALLEGQADVDPEGVVRAGALQAGGHDPGPGAGHRRPAVGGQQGGQVAGLGVKGIGREGARRAEHGDLAHVTVGGEDLEPLAHLLQGGVGDLEVQAVRAVRRQSHHRLEDLQQLIAVGGDAHGVEQSGELFGRNPPVGHGAFAQRGAAARSTSQMTWSEVT